MTSAAEPWIDCAIEAVQTAGDHFVVIGRVLDLGTSGGPAGPGLSSALLETMMSWPRQQDWI